MDPETLLRWAHEHEQAGLHELALDGYRAAIADARTDRIAALDGIARCERALGSSEDWNK